MEFLLLLVLSGSSNVVQGPPSSDNETNSNTSNNGDYVDTSTAAKGLLPSDNEADINTAFSADTILNDSSSASEANCNTDSDSYADDADSTDTDVSIELSGSGFDTSGESQSNSSSETSSTDSVASGASDFENLSKNSKNAALMLLNCFKRHNLTSSACSDILKTVRQVLPNVKNNPLLHYRKVLSYTPSSSYKEVHYCSKCEYVFPKDGPILQCETDNCGGIVKTFMLADVKEVLKSLLKSPGKKKPIVFFLAHLSTKCSR